MSKQVKVNKRQNRRRKARPSIFTVGLGGRAPMIMPPRHKAIMSFIDDSMTRVSAGNQYYYFRLYANAVWDPDPLILTGAIAGFAELSAIYNRYRVLKCWYEWRVTNKDNNPTQLGVVFSNEDLATVVTSVATATDVLENPFSSGVRTLSQAGGMDRAIVQGQCNLGQLYGDPRTYKTILQTSALGNSNPAVLLYVNFIAFTDQNYVKGLFSGLRVRYEVEWFDRKNM